MFTFLKYVVKDAESQSRPCGCIFNIRSLFLSQRASAMATAIVWTAVCVNSAVTSPPVLTARPACLVTMETRPMAANARVSAASPQKWVILLTGDLTDLLVIVLVKQSTDVVNIYLTALIFSQSPAYISF